MSLFMTADSLGATDNADALPPRGPLTGPRHSSGTRARQAGGQAGGRARVRPPGAASRARCRPLCSGPSGWAADRPHVAGRANERMMVTHVPLQLRS